MSRRDPMAALAAPLCAAREHIAKHSVTLDCDELHVSTPNRVSASAFARPASSCGLDKHVVGGLAAVVPHGVTQNQLAQYLHENGSNGGSGWCQSPDASRCSCWHRARWHNADSPWRAERSPLQPPRAAHSDPGKCPQ